MDVSALYPAESSVWTAPDGSEHNMQCSSRFSTSGGEDIVCPDPFLRPVVADNANPCVYSCPIHTYSSSEYLSMSLWTTIPGLVGFFINAFMAM